MTGSADILATGIMAILAMAALCAVVWWPAEGMDRAFKLMTGE